MKAKEIALKVCHYLFDLIITGTYSYEIYKIILFWINDTHYIAISSIFFLGGIMFLYLVFDSVLSVYKTHHFLRFALVLINVIITIVIISLFTEETRQIIYYQLGITFGFLIYIFLLVLIEKIYDKFFDNYVKLDDSLTISSLEKENDDLSEKMFTKENSWTNSQEETENDSDIIKKSEDCSFVIEKEGFAENQKEEEVII